MQNTLLSDGTSTCGVTGCNSSSAQTSIEGTLSIDPEFSDVTWNVNKSDIYEVSGTCKDLGRKNNRILVQVFHREDDQSITPYIDNSISNLCQTTDAGIATTEQCFFVTHGNSLVDGDQLYPQCINGRFSFLVRLGAIIDIASVRKSYLVRMKLRTTDGTTSDSGWATQTIKRGLSAPTFSLTTDISNFRCEIKIDPFKFKHSPYAIGTNPNIQYDILRQVTGYSATGAENKSAMVSRLTGLANFDFSAPIVVGDSLAHFYDGNCFSFPCPSYAVVPASSGYLYPGMKYTYNVAAVLGSVSTSSDTTKTCTMEPPFLTGTITGGTICDITMSTGSFNWMNYEWYYSTSSLWTSAQSNAAAGAAFLTTASSFYSWNMTALPAGSYYVAARAHDGAGRYGKWSNELKCTRN